MRVVDNVNGVPVKVWDNGVEMDIATINQMKMIGQLPSVFHHVALMPDGHLGIGATVGSVIATRKAIAPANVGVDIGCGMIAVRTSLTATDMPDSLAGLRVAIEDAVPHGGPGTRGSWAEAGRYGPSNQALNRARVLDIGYQAILAKHPKIAGRENTNANQMGTLGGGNHFIEICLDEHDNVWVMLHSGSRGVGNRIGSYFIERAKEEMVAQGISLPDKDLAYLTEDTENFNDYWSALRWAQEYAKQNRDVMMLAVLRALSAMVPKAFFTKGEAVNCHHNYASYETHFGEEVFITRKGAISAREGEYGIIPGSMGTRSYIVKGKGNPDSFMSASHGAGRRMSRGEAKRTFTLEDHARAMTGVEGRLDAGVIDETPGAYKDIDSVIAAESDLVEVMHTLKQIVVVKG